MRIKLHYAVFSLALLIVIHTAFAQSDAFNVSPQQMFAGVDAATVRQFVAVSNTLQRNPNDVNALISRAGISLNISNRSLYSFQWVHFAAKDLERALRLDPNNFPAHHDYGMACFKAGDVNDAQPVMHLAVMQFTKAIQLRPDSARSYMGRGWAYLMLDDPTHANADFQQALQLNPGLRSELTTEAEAIRQKRAQKGCITAMMQRMGAYIVNRNARTPEQCAAAKGYWTHSECRISTAMAPGPVMGDPTGNAGLGGHSCPPPPDAVNNKYSSRAGGYVVK
jgi:tetratricopeptide (TPR) repeat protein